MPVVNTAPTVARIEVAAQPGEDPTAVLVRDLNDVAARRHPPAGPLPGSSQAAIAHYRLMAREWAKRETARAAVARAEAEGRQLAAHCAAGGVLVGLGIGLVLAVASAAMGG